MRNMTKEFYEWLAYIRKEARESESLSLSDFKKTFSANSIFNLTPNINKAVCNPESIIYSPQKNTDTFKKILSQK